MALELQQASPDITLPLSWLIIFLILAGGSIILYVKSKNIPSNSLKTSISSSFIFALVGSIWMILLIFNYGRDLLFRFMVNGLLILFLISLISSIIALIKIEKKSLAIWALLLSVPNIVSLISMALMSIGAGT